MLLKTLKLQEIISLKNSFKTYGFVNSVLLISMKYTENRYKYYLIRKEDYNK